MKVVDKTQVITLNSIRKERLSMWQFWSKDHHYFPISFNFFNFISFFNHFSSGIITSGSFFNLIKSTILFKMFPVQENPIYACHRIPRFIGQSVINT